MDLAWWYTAILTELVGVEGSIFKVILTYTVRATRDIISKRNHFKYYFRDENFIKNLLLTKCRGTDH